MEIKNFDELRITTMTLVLTLSDPVDMVLAHQLLPITKVEINQPRFSAKCKLPHTGHSGDILSARHCGNVRGIVRSSAGSFKNAVTVDICTQTKNISLKLSTESIQMCGASSKEDGTEAANEIIKHLIKVQEYIDKLKNDPVAEKTLEWVKNNIKGYKMDKPAYKIIQGNNLNLRVFTGNDIDHSISKPLVAIPKDLDKEFAEYLISLSEDFIYHSDICKKYEFLRKVSYVSNPSLHVTEYYEAMVNYNYYLGFEVDRFQLNNAIDRRYGFISRYNNALSNSVTVELPYEPVNNKNSKRRKNKIPHHTFLIYKSGAVTQSGPGGDLMKEAYYLFMNTIKEIEPHIRYSV